jgi:hypothetical protein
VARRRFDVDVNERGVRRRGRVPRRRGLRGGQRVDNSGKVIKERTGSVMEIEEHGN